MEVFGGIWRYMEVYEGIWKYISIYKPTLSTLFFFNFVGPTFSTLFFFQLFGGPLLPIGFFQLIWRSTGTGRYLIFFLVKFPVDCRQNHVWGPIFCTSYDHIYKNVHVVQILTSGNALGPKIWQFYQIYQLWASNFLKLF